MSGRVDPSIRVVAAGGKKFIVPQSNIAQISGRSSATWAKTSVTPRHTMSVLPRCRRAAGGLSDRPVFTRSPPSAAVRLMTTSTSAKPVLPGRRPPRPGGRAGPPRRRVADVDVSLTAAAPAWAASIAEAVIASEGDQLLCAPRRHSARAGHGAGDEGLHFLGRGRFRRSAYWPKKAASRVPALGELNLSGVGPAPDDPSLGHHDHAVGDRARIRAAGCG